MTLKPLAETIGTRLSGRQHVPGYTWARSMVIGVDAFSTDNSTGVSARRGRHP